MPVAGRRPPPLDIDQVTQVVDRRRPSDLDPVTEVVDPQPTEVVDPQPTEVVDPQPTDVLDPQPTEVIDPQATEVVERRRQAIEVIERRRRATERPDETDDAQPTEALAARSRRVPRPAPDPVWRGNALVRTPMPDPGGSSSWSTWIAPRLRKRAWWLPILVAFIAVAVLVTAAAMLGD